MSNQLYKLMISWTHNKFGPETANYSAEGTSIRRALNKALLEFFTDAGSRSKRRDAHKMLTVSIYRVKKPQADR